MAHRAPWSGGYVEWNGELPRIKEPPIPRLKIWPGPRYDLRVCSTRSFSLLVHWAGENNYPCTDDTGAHCWFDHTAYNFQKAVQVWLHVTDRRRHTQHLICLGKQALIDAPPLRDKGVSLRGAHILVWRAGTSVRQPIKVKLELNPDLAERVDQECDLKKIVLGMWTDFVPASAGDTSTKAEPRPAARKPAVARPDIPALPEPTDAKTDAKAAKEWMRRQREGGAK